MPAYKDERDGTWRYRKQIKTLDGKTVRISGTAVLANTMGAAEQAERDHILRILEPERAIARAALVPEPVTSLPTLREFAKRFLAEYAPREGSGRSITSRRLLIEGAIVPFFGSYRLDMINQSIVNAFITAQRKSATQTLNNKLSALSTLLGYAADVGIIPPTTLKLHVSERKVREVGAEEVDAVLIEDVDKLLHVAPDHRYVVAVLLAAEAGLRIGEVRGVQWSDVKHERLTVRRSIDETNLIGPPKNGKPRTIPLSGRILAALESLPRTSIWLLVHKSDRKHKHPFLLYKPMLKVITAMYEIAKVPRNISPWHSLRHTFGSQLNAQNVPVATIQRLMGHADITTTMRYISVNDRQLDDAIERAFRHEPLPTKP